MEDLKTFAREKGAEEASELTHWDINFWSERLREAKYDINEVDGLLPLCIEVHFTHTHTLIFTYFIY